MQYFYTIAETFQVRCCFNLLYLRSQKVLKFNFISEYLYSIPEITQVPFYF